MYAKGWDWSHEGAQGLSEFLVSRSGLSPARAAPSPLRGCGDKPAGILQGPPLGESGQFDEALDIKDADPLAFARDEASSDKFAEGPVDVDCAKPGALCNALLRERPVDEIAASGESTPRRR